MSRYNVVIKKLYNLKLFGIIIKKGTTYYNIKDIYKDCFVLQKSKRNINIVTKQCKYLNNYNKAQRYIIARDKNNIYWLFNKTKYTGKVIKDKNNVYYIKLNKHGIFKSINNLKTGCKTIENAKKTLKQVYILYKKEKNSNLYTIED